MNPEYSLRELAKALEQSAIFAGCPEIALQKIALASRVRHFPKGSVIFFQSDPGGAMYLVLAGTVTILLSNPDGRELVINEVRPGDYFGEISLITQQPRSASAVAHDPCDLLMIPSEIFQETLSSQPQLARRMLVSTARRLSDSTERESALAFLDAAGRIVRILLLLDQENSEIGYMTLSQDELAQRTGLTRQTVAKILGRWRRAGWLLTGRGRIMLLDRQSLREVGEHSRL
jgi:CRP/FNR family cyclic AMP-dependent transcriptional regulator